MRRVLLIALLLGACTRHAPVETGVSAEEAKPMKARPSEPKIRAQRPTPGLDARTAYALAEGIGQALSAPSLARAEALETLRKDWQGKRFRWEVGVSVPLCSGPTACNVLPFDHARAEARIVQGWLPRLTLDPSTHADLLARCDQGLCVATVEGTLSSFVLSPDEPTSLTFSDVEVAYVRARREGESWVRRRTDPRVAGLRTGR